MADVPKDLLQEIERLERLFSVPKEKLKAITEHFISELTKGDSTALLIVENAHVLQDSASKVAAS